MKKRLHAVVGTLLALSMAGQAFALGTASYSSELISARSLGQGAVGVAGVDSDASVSYLNPAAMTGLAGTQLMISGIYANASPKFTNEGSDTQAGSGQVTGARATSVFIPNFGVTSQFMDGKLAAGVAVVAPYGLETHWDGDSPMRYNATDARLRIIDITPAVAYKVNDMVSVGVAGDYYDTVDGQLSKALNITGINAALGAPTLQPDGAAALTATGGGFGYHLGATFKPNAWNQLGIVYHSNVKMSLNGSINANGFAGASAAVFGPNFTTTVSAPVFIPQNVQLGYAFMPSKEWRYEVNAAWYDWYDARQLGITYNGLTAVQNAILQTNNPQQFKPRKTINFGLGANYKPNDDLQLRGGAYYEAASLPETAFDPAFVDLPRYGLTVGAGYQFTPVLSGDIAYNAVFFHGRAINNNNGFDGYSGNFNSFANLVSAQLNCKFDTHF